MDCPNCGTEKMYYWEKKAIGLRWKGYECHNCFCKIQTATIKGVGASRKVIKKRLVLEPGLSKDDMKWKDMSTWPKD